MKVARPAQVMALTLSLASLLSASAISPAAPSAGSPRITAASSAGVVARSKTLTTSISLPSAPAAFSANISQESDAEFLKQSRFHPARIKAHLHHSASVPAWKLWAQSAAVQAITDCESKHVPTAVNGKYTGLLQMDPDFWFTYGGGRFASLPLYASSDHQYQVAYQGYLARGFEPWQCAQILGYA